MWRSLLFVPVLEERFVAKAGERGADAVVLDLEASIAETRKADARAAVPDAVAKLSSSVEVTVRINPVSEGAADDLEACIIEGVTTVHLARCEAADEIKTIDAIIGKLESRRNLPPGGIRIVAMLESPGAVIHAEAIGLASKRMTAMTLGVEDYAVVMGATPNDDLLRPAAYQVIQSARASGIAPLVVPMTLSDFKNINGLEDAATYARRIGATGGYAVHPGQIAVLNRVFSPTDEETGWARRIIEAARAAEKSGQGVFQIDGRMIDLPVIKRARSILGIK